MYLIKWELDAIFQVPIHIIELNRNQVSWRQKRNASYSVSTCAECSRLRWVHVMHLVTFTHGIASLKLTWTMWSTRKNSWLLLGTWHCIIYDLHGISFFQLSQNIFIWTNRVIALHRAAHLSHTLSNPHLSSTNGGSKELFEVDDEDGDSPSSTDGVEDGKTTGTVFKLTTLSNL